MESNGTLHPSTTVGRLGVWKTDGALPAGWETWIARAGADDGETLRWLREEIKSARTRRYVCVVVCTASKGDGWLDVVAGDTPVDTVREALQSTGEFSMGNESRDAMIEIQVEPWSDDVTLLEDARWEVDAEITEISRQRAALQ